MANTLLTPTLISKSVLGFWQESNILTGLFNRAYESEFGGGSGDTVTIRKQPSLTATAYNRTNGLVIQDVVESSITVTVDTLYDVSVEILQEEWDMDVADFNWQVAEPAGRALARTAETLVSAQMAAHASPITVPQVELLDGLTDARTAMNKLEVPMDQRFIAVSSDVGGMLLKDPQFRKYNEAGDANALRSAMIGRILNMDVYESPVLTALDAYVCHKDSLTFASIVPQLSKGAANGSVGTYDGLGLRTVFGYDQNLKKDIISFDAYYEVAPLRGETAYTRLIVTPTP